MIVCPNLNKIKTIKHGFFTRNGGVSTGIYKSLNCGPGSNDDKSSVEKNRQIILQELAANEKKLCTLYQCHSSDVVILRNPSEFVLGTKADALVTNNNKIVLGILTADCAPVLFSDHNKSIIGAAHAGWKGAIGGVLENTVAAMFELGANHSDIVATIGPCIGPDSYEVKDDFREKFLSEDSDSNGFFKMTTKKGQYLFNLPGYVESRLKKLGLKHVSWIGRDTLPDENNFFSFRRTTIRGEKDYGRQISAISLN